MFYCLFMFALLILKLRIELSLNKLIAYMSHYINTIIDHPNVIPHPYVQRSLVHSVPINILNKVCPHCASMYARYTGTKITTDEVFLKYIRHVGKSTIH